MNKVFAIVASWILFSSVAFGGDVVVDGKLKSTLMNGSPIEVSSTDKVLNLNADLLDGFSADQFAPREHDHLDMVQYKRTIVVSPVIVDGEPDSTASGDALLSTVDSILDASATNPYLIKLEPGAYFLGSQSLVLKPWVHLEGAGQGITVIRSSGFNDIYQGTVIGSTFSKISSLNINCNASSGTNAVCFYDSGGLNFIEDVAMAAVGGDTAIGVFVSDSASINLTDAIVTASLAQINEGIVAESSGISTYNVRISSWGASTTNAGIYSLGSSMSLRQSYVGVDSNNVADAVAIYAYQAGSVELENAEVQAWNGTDETLGVYLQSTRLEAELTTISGWGPAGGGAVFWEHPMNNNTMEIRRCYLYGATYSVGMNALEPGLIFNIDFSRTLGPIEFDGYSSGTCISVYPYDWGGAPLDVYCMPPAGSSSGKTRSSKAREPRVQLIPEAGGTFLAETSETAEQTDHLTVTPRQPKLSDSLQYPR